MSFNMWTSRRCSSIAKWSILILVLITISGCGKATTSKLQQLKVGMTVKQVEEILGKPIETWTSHGKDSRRYKGDGNHEIIVIYKNGTLEEVKEDEIYRGPRLPIG